MTIRLARVGDLSSIKACAREAYAVYLDRIGREPAPMVANFADQIVDGIVYVIEDRSEVAGFIVFYPRDDHVHLENVAVRDSARGKGLGARLIDHAEARARELGFPRIKLYTNEKMTENVPYYLARGYVETGRREEDGFKRIFFQKLL